MGRALRNNSCGVGIDGHHGWPPADNSADRDQLARAHAVPRDVLVDLAADVKAILGPATKVTYSADWSEYFGHQPPDGSGDVYFHLDPLWSSADIDAIGIDVYWPL